MKHKFTFLVLLAFALALKVSAQQSVTLYVSAATGNDANLGITPNAPLKTLSWAIQMMRADDFNDNVTILVEKGTYYPYDENGDLTNIGTRTFTMFRNQNNQAGKSLRVLGGYDFTTGTRDIANNLTILDGGRRSGGGVDHIITIGLVNETADSLVIEGFNVTGAAQTGHYEYEILPGQLFIGSESGGGLTVMGCTSNKIAIRNCIFSDNEKWLGGAVAMRATTGISFQNCVFQGNTVGYEPSVASSGEGGAVFMTYSSPNFLNCIFYGNNANISGAAMSISNPDGPELVTIGNCTFTANNAGDHNLIYSALSGKIYLTNSIIWEDDNGAYRLTLPGSRLTGEIFASYFITKWGPFATDPVYYFISPQFRDGNNPMGPDGKWFTDDDGLQIDPCGTTPALDGGNNNYAAGSLATDILGRPRISAGTIDLGAYEDQTPVQNYYQDTDKDGFGSSASTVRARCEPDGYSTKGGDCNDNDSTIYPGAREICGDNKDNDCNGFVDDVLLKLNFPDNDGDGFGDPNGIGRLFCGQEPGYSLNNSDCNDTNKDIYPGATEICDGFDNDCNGQIDEGITKAYLPDADGDGYGQDGVQPTLSCTPLAGYVLQPGDCDDNDPAVHRHATEICDGKDNDCDGHIDNNIQGPSYYPDNDGDGHGDKSFNGDVHCPLPGYVTSNDDCNDNDNTIFFGAPEICDGKDNDCNGQIDEGVRLDYYIDADGDGWGTGGPVQSCTPLQGYALRSGDCNDNDNTIYPDAPERCDGKDNNCNGLFDENIKVNYYIDADGDGFGVSSNPVLSCTPVAGRTTTAGDCNDADNTIYPDAPELCDSKDNDCNGQIDNEVSEQIRYYRDSDADGYGYSQDFVLNCSPVAGRVLIGGDCDDNDYTIYPGVGGCASLPLTLVDFTIKEEGQKAIAYWTTTDEINTHHFELERSEDGNQFKAIGTVAAMNTPGDHNYSFVDPQPLGGRNYYRIKMMDIDGTYTYSRIASLHTNGAHVISAIYPNPASDIVNVVINESSNDLSIQLISLNGKVLQTKQYAVRGTHQLNVAKLPAGIYFIKVSNGDIHKLVKQ